VIEKPPSFFAFVGYLYPKVEIVYFITKITFSPLKFIFY